MKILTAVLLFGAAVCLSGWAVLRLHELGLHPMRKMAEWMRRCSVLEVALVAIMAAGPIYRAGSKTNGVPDRSGENVKCKIENVKLGDAPMIVPASTETGILHSTFYTLHSHTNSDWLAFGGYKDWFYLGDGGWCFRFGSNLVERVTVFSCGEIASAPFGASNRISLLGIPLSIVPAANWHLLTPKRSLFWHAATPSNSLLLTWENALANRDTNQPVTVQAELFPDGAAAFRYDFSGIGDISALSNAVSQEPYGQFATHLRQQFHITANGTVSITKHGSVVARGTNDVTTLNGVIQQ